MIKKENDVISNYLSNITGFNSFIDSNNVNRSKCVRTKKYKEGLVSRIKSKISSKKAKREEIEKKRKIVGWIVDSLKPAMILPALALALLGAQLFASSAFITGEIVFFQFCFMTVLDYFTIDRLDNKIKKIDEEILNDEKECTNLEAEIARIQVTMDKIDMSNKITEEKIVILKDVVSKLETMVVPEGAQRVVQVQPAKGVQNCDNVQFASSNMHQLALN